MGAMSVHGPVRVACLAALTVVVVYIGLTAIWLSQGQGEPDGGWLQHIVSASIQVAGWSVLAWLTALVWGALGRGRAKSAPVDNARSDGG